MIGPLLLAQLGFIYDYTTTEVPAHVELRGLAVAAIAGRHSVLKSTLRNEAIVELRSSADLKTDLLLGGQNGPKAEHVIFMCDNCHYAHAGSHNCSYIASNNSLRLGRFCPQCGNGPGTTSKRYMHSVDLFSAISCPSCDGIHTASPIQPGPEPEPEP